MFTRSSVAVYYYSYSSRLYTTNITRRIAAPSSSSTTATTILLQQQQQQHQQQKRRCCFSNIATAANNTRRTTTIPLSSYNNQHQQKRFFARTSETAENDPNLSPEIKARNFIMQTGYTKNTDVAQGVIDALIESGVTGTALLTTIRSMAGRWEVGEDAGLEALVEAVKLTLSRSDGRQEPITLYCIPANAWKSSEEDQEDFSAIEETPEEREAMMTRAFTVKANTGLTLTDVAKFGDGDGASCLGEYLECSCAGIMACSTCHVVIDPQWYDKVGKPNEDEQDMLDLAYAPRETSRLGCQIVLNDNMDGMIIRLPKLWNNLMDHVPFED